MVIDTSALVAMLSDEPDAEMFEAAVDANQAEAARLAYRRFGKGRHPGLN